MNRVSNTPGWQRRIAGPQARRFPAASILHRQLEDAARELHELRARVADSEATGTPLVAPPVRLWHGEAAEDPLRPEAGDVPAASWWPTSTGAGPEMKVAPGHRAAGLTQASVPTVAISCCGLNAGATAAAIDEVVAEQIESRAFVALYLADDAAHLHLFRHQGLDVELIPRIQDLGEVGGAVSPEVFLARRLAQIASAWGVEGLVDRGTRRLPWSVKAAAPEVSPKVFFYKDYRRHNPYQHLFYMAMSRISAVPGDLEAAIDSAAMRPTAFHLNWEEAIFRHAASAAEAGQIVEVFLARLDDLLAVGGRLVWTLHNAAPHDDRYPEVYRHLARGIASRCQLAIAHSAAGAQLAVQTWGVPPDLVCEVPHGSYHRLYPQEGDRGAARRAVGLDADGPVLGFVGNIRPYKNVRLLIDAFASLPRGTATLLLAGMQEPPLELDGLDPDAAKEIVVRDRVIPEAELAMHLRACDAIVLPFARVLTSGSMMLALSLGIPVVVPAINSLTETIENGYNGFTFEEGDRDSLAERLAGVAALGPTQRRRLASGALNTARLADWDWIGRHVAGRIRALF